MSPVKTDTSVIENRAPNVAAQFRERVAKSPDLEAYRYPTEDGKPWTSLTWKQTGDKVEKLAAGLLALGIESEQRVGIAVGHAVRVDPGRSGGHVCRGRHHDRLSQHQRRRDAPTSWPTRECRIVFAEDAGQLAKLTEHRVRAAQPQKVVLFDGTGDGDWVITLADLGELGREVSARASRGCRGHEPMRSRRSNWRR